MPLDISDTPKSIMNKSCFKEGFLTVHQHNETQLTPKPNSDVVSESPPLALQLPGPLSPTCHPPIPGAQLWF
jgi:hypothetical protein